MVDRRARRHSRRPDRLHLGADANIKRGDCIFALGIDLVGLHQHGVETVEIDLAVGSGMIAAGSVLTGMTSVVSER